MFIDQTHAGHDEEDSHNRLTRFLKAIEHRLTSFEKILQAPKGSLRPSPIFTVALILCRFSSLFFVLLAFGCKFSFGFESEAYLFSRCSISLFFISLCASNFSLFLHLEDSPMVIDKKVQLLAALSQQHFVAATPVVSWVLHAVSVREWHIIVGFGVSWCYLLTTMRRIAFVHTEKLTLFFRADFPFFLLRLSATQSFAVGPSRRTPAPIP